MPHVPLNFSEPPEGAKGTRTSRALAPADAAEALGVGLPADVPPRADKPAATYTGPRKRTTRALRIKERPVNMQRWDVSPYDIGKQLGINDG